MTSINSSLANYYQLFGQTSGQTSTNTTGTSASATPSLADILAESDSDDDSNSSDSSAYLMDLSPAAQAYLNSNSSSASSPSADASSLVSILDGTSDSSDASSSTDSTNFTLTSSQQTQITNILAKYKDAPYTQATFDSIQNDLNNAGLGTSQLSSADQISSFNATDVLIGDLDGTDTSPTPATTSASDEQTKSSNYMQSIMSQWQSTSSTYSANDASGASTVGATS